MKIPSFFYPWAETSALHMNITRSFIHEPKQLHAKCFVRYLRTCCFCIRNLTRSLSSLRFLIRQQLMCKYHTPALPSHEVFYIILGTKKMTTRCIYSSKLSLLFAGKSKAASRGRQDRGRPSLMQPAQTAWQQRGGEKRGEWKWKYQGKNYGHSETMFCAIKWNTEMRRSKTCAM